MLKLLVGIGKYWELDFCGNISDVCTDGLSSEVSYLLRGLTFLFKVSTGHKNKSFGKYPRDYLNHSYFLIIAASVLKPTHTSRQTNSEKNKTLHPENISQKC